MKPVYSDALAADQILDWDKSDYFTLDARKFGPADLGTSAVVTYGYLGDGQTQDVDEDDDEGEVPMTPDQIAIYEEVLQLIMDVADVDFVQVSQAAAPIAMLRVQAWGNGGGQAPPVVTEREGEADLLGSTTVNISDANFNLRLALHETLHGIGLDHPGDYDGTGFTYEDDAHYFQDSRQYTVMSYWDATETGANYTFSSGQTLMLHDVMAVQKLYGANTAAFAADTIYGYGSNTGRSPWTMDNNGDHMFGAIWDTGGHDIIDLSLVGGDSEIDLRQGAYSSSGPWQYNFAIAFGSVIEELRTGSGNDRLDGNDADNILIGNDGDDVFYGRGGEDEMYGGYGADYFVGGPGADLIDGGAHADTVDYGGALGGMWLNLVTGQARRLSGSAIDTLISIENLYGSNFGDVIEGNTQQNLLFGRDGNDFIWGNNGDDTLTGGNGNDRLYGGGDADTIFGGADNDTIFGGSGDDSLNGGTGIDWLQSASSQDWAIDLRNGVAHAGGEVDTLASIENARTGSGNDTITGTNGANTLEGGAGDDVLRGLAGADVLRGQAGADLLYGGHGADLLVGGDGSDILIGGNGDDLLRGGDGADLLRGNAGQDSYQGGRGRDTVTFATETHWVSVDLLAGQAVTFGTVEQLSGIENLIGSGHGDVMLGDHRANNLQGGAGDDDIGGRNGNDVILGQGGDDTIRGGFGDDQISGGLGTDFMDGGAGRDRIDYRYSQDGWVIDLEAELATRMGGGSEQILNFEHVFGAQGNDAIRGTGVANNLQGLAGHDRIEGRDGDDVILGGAGDDTLFGGAGNDLINGGTGTDAMDGGAGFDRVDYSYSGSAWQIDLAASSATRAGGGSEVIRNFEHATGGRAGDEIAGSDLGNVLRGGLGDDSLFGRDGADRLDGNADDDRLYGGNGNDRLYGGGGDDWFYGGAGADDHYGGAGRDVFIFIEASESVGFSRDVLRPGTGGAFERGLDLISLAGIDANETLRGDQAFTLGGTAAGQLHIYDSTNGFTVIDGHTDSDGFADFRLLIEDGSRAAWVYDATDFIL